MSAWAITQTTRFKAAVVGAGISDMASEFGTEMHGSAQYDHWFYGVPFEKGRVSSRALRLRTSRKRKRRP